MNVQGGPSGARSARLWMYGSSSWTVPFAVLPIVILYTGYAYGTGRQIFLPWVFRGIDRTYLTSDWFTNTPPHHLDSVIVLSWVGKVLSLPNVFIVLFVLSLYLLFWVTYRFSDWMFRDIRVFFVSVFLFLRWGVHGLGGNVLWFNNVVQHTTAVPICLAAFYLMGRGRHYWAVVTAAGATYVHIQLGTLTMLLIAAGGMVGGGATVRRKLPVAAALYGLVAGPTLVRHWLHYVAGGDVLSAQEYLLINGFIRHPHHLIPSTWPAYDFYQFAVLLVIAALGARWGKQPHRQVLVWCCAIGFLCVVGTVFVEWFPVKLVIQSQLFRTTVFLRYFGSLYAAAALVGILREARLYERMAAAWTIAATHFALVGAAVPLLVASRIPKMRRLGLVLSAGLVGLLLVWSARPDTEAGFWNALRVPPIALFNAAILGAAIFGTFRLRPPFFCAALAAFMLLNGWRLGFRPIHLNSPPDSPYVRFCDRVPSVTPENAVIIKPPSQLGFQLLANRAEIANWKWMPFHEEDMVEWRRRLGDLAGLEHLWCRGWEECNEILEEGYSSLSEEQILFLAQQYKANYIVRRVGAELSFPEVMRHSNLILYKVPR